MIERSLIEYFANAFWQLPLLAAGAWMLLRMVRPGPAAQHWVWLAVLAAALLLPLHGAVYGDPQANVVRPANVAQAAGFAQNPFSGNAFDAVGEPSGLVFGQPSGGHATAGAGPSLSRLAKVDGVRRVRLNAIAASGIVGLFLAAALLGLFRLARAWWRARDLVKDSREIDLSDRERAAVAESARRIGVRPPRVREAPAARPGGISGPVVVGAARPVLLWPENFARELLAEQREDELMAALCHEMAHIRRHDYLMNLLCEAAALPLKWHPATYRVEQRIRSTREMACDAIAAQGMESEMSYAKCLLRLAQSMVAANGRAGAPVAGSAAAGLFNGNALEERIMRLMQGRTAMSLRAKLVRAVAGAAAMIAAAGLAAMFHVVPAMAQIKATEAQSAAAPAVAPDSPATPVNQTVVPAMPADPPPALPVVAPAAVVPAAALALAPAPVPQAAPAGAPQIEPTAPVTPDVQEPHVAPKAGTGHVHSTKCKHENSFAIVNGQERELTPEERARLETQLAEAQKKIAAETTRLNSPEFRQQIEEAQRKAKEAAQAIENGELQKQMADAQQQLAAAKAKWNSPELRKQIEEAQRQAMKADAELNSAEFQQRMAEAQRDAEEAARKVNSAEFQKQMADAQKQIADALARMKAEQEAAEQEKNETK
jgi:beta-lactamase regulating signal transducer with metallopeptidase domain